MVTGFGVGFTASSHKFAAAAVGARIVPITQGSAADTTTSDWFIGGASWSVDYTNTNDRLTIDESEYSDIKTGTGAFTVEGWFKPDLAGAPSQGESRFFYFGGAVNGANSFACAITTAGGIFRGPGATNLNFTQSNTGWMHYAFVYDGTNKSVYVNGSRVATIAASLDVSDTTDPIIGSALADDRFNYSGGIDEFRISSVARYTGTSYDIPGGPFTSDDDTLLLLHMDGPSTSAVNDAQKDTANKKFGISSLLLDGTNDRIEVSGDYSQAGDFTAECWFYPTSTSGTRCIFAIGNEATDRQFVNVQGSNIYTDEYGAGGVDINGSGGGVTTDTWHHCALVREGSTVSLYLNGTRKGTTTSTATIGNSSNIYIGTLSDGAVDFVGNIDEFRLSNVARYSGASYTTPTEAFVKDTQTQVLLHMTGSDANTGFGFEDDIQTGSVLRVANDITTNGTVTLDTGNKQFGAGSAEFNDSNSNYLQVDDASLGNFNGPFTIECWIYTADTEGEFMGCQDFGTNEGWAFVTRSLQRLIWTAPTTPGGNVSAIISSNSAYTDNTWTHVAVVYDGSRTSIYAGGSRVATSTSYVEPNAVASGDEFFIGGNIYGVSSGLYSDGPRAFNGDIDEIRISRCARYHGTSYTVPTAAFTNDSETVLLLHNNATPFADDGGA